MTGIIIHNHSAKWNITNEILKNIMVFAWVGRMLETIPETQRYRGKWGNAGPLSISSYKYNTNHGNIEQSSSLSRTGHIVTSNMSTVTLDP